MPFRAFSFVIPKYFLAFQKIPKQPFHLAFRNGVSKTEFQQMYELGISHLLLIVSVFVIIFG